VSAIAVVGRDLWRWFRVLWVCRVSLASVLACAYLVAGTVQARDMFADLGVKWYEWIIFFFFIFLWSWIVHAAARRAVQYDEWVAEAHIGNGLSDDVRQKLQREFYAPALIIPRLLGLGIFAFVAIAIWRTRHSLGGAEAGLVEARSAIHLTTALLGGVLTSAVLYIVLVWKRRRFGDWLVSARLKQVNIEAPLLARVPTLLQRVLSPLEYRKRLADLGHSPLDIALILARVGILGCLLFAIVDPLGLAGEVPRLFFVPLLLGGVVVLLGEIGAWSFYLRTPLLLLVAILSIGSIFLTTRFHDVRWVKNSDPRPAARQISLSEAVRRWRVANHCDNDTKACPRPILIAAAGGASRAAFLTGTVVGSLIDLGLNPEAENRYGDITNRIFAFSTVSGGSVAGVVIRAALLDAAAGPSPRKPPCQWEGTGSWFGHSIFMARSGIQFDPTQSWRDCFQLLLAGDFLSPVLVGLAYRDNFPLPRSLRGDPLWSDRAVLLEQAFERRYAYITRSDRKRVSCPDGAAGSGATGLCRLFGYHPDLSAQHLWIPLLFINGTSVWSGRRIITSDVPASDREAPSKQLFPLAYDLNEIRASTKAAATNDTGGETTASKEGDDDIRLSTAATMSARFPIISPQGVLREQTSRERDLIVDGGYFENDGLATLADAVIDLRQGFNLDPVVIRITNEPVSLQDRSLGHDRPPLPERAQRTPFADFSSVFQALTATRSGHEDESEAYLKSVLAGADRLYEIGVHPLAKTGVSHGTPNGPSVTNPFCRTNVGEAAKLENVSMSWWLSHPVQAYLDAQLCVNENWERLECELRRTPPRDHCAAATAVNH
jgi:hypothetical protein